MPPAEKKADGLALIFGGGGKKPPLPSPKGEPDGDEGEDKGSMDDPAFDSAYSEYEANPSKETFWRAVKACMESY